MAEDDPLIDSLLDFNPAIRYVATYLDGILKTGLRPNTAGASDSETDKYEELLVNPTLLKLTSQRGNLDCGGLDYVLVRYGNFVQFVWAHPKGHVSVCIEHDARVYEISENLCLQLNQINSF